MPDCSSHIDWLIARDDAGSLPLLTFRLPEVFHRLSTFVPLVAEKIADHRPHYLTYEGPLTENRGSVKRLARGLITRWAQVAQPGAVIEMQVRWQPDGCDERVVAGAECVQQLRLSEQKPDFWLLESLPPAAAFR